jgi:hypothetical protein
VARPKKFGAMLPPVSLTPEFLARVKAMADHLGESLADYVRSALAARLEAEERVLARPEEPRGRGGKG